VTDQEVRPGGDAPPGTTDDPDTDYGFQTSLAEPDQYSKGAQPDPLPPAGPRRARAPHLLVAHRRVGRTGNLAVGLRCPVHWPSGDAGCRGVATLEGARRAVRYDVPPGETRLVRFRVTKQRVKALRRARTDALTATATNEDALTGASSRLDLAVRAPRARRPSTPRATARRRSR
jgi:hypothetical protein